MLNRDIIDLNLLECHRVYNNIGFISKFNYSNRASIITFSYFDEFIEETVVKEYDKSLTPDIDTLMSLIKESEYQDKIVVAVPNNIERLKLISPELFLPGRLVPVYFGYVSPKTIQDISKFYFKQKITKKIPEFITIPTSDIISSALDALGDFNMFEKSLFDLINNQKID